jgi:predicted glycosyltransferase
VIPNGALDGLNLIWHSDLLVSGGGTMNREAAALGVPVYSIFRGTIGAVDRHLQQSGRLVLIESVEDVAAKIRLEKRPYKSLGEATSRRSLDQIVKTVEELAESISSRRQ